MAVSVTSKPYFKRILIALGAALFVSIVVVVLYNMNIIKSETDSIALKDDFIYEKGLSKVNDGTSGMNPRIQTRTLSLPSSRRLFILEAVRKIIRALDLLEANLPVESVLKSWQETTQEIFSRSFEYTIILEAIELWTEQEPIEYLEVLNLKVTKELTVDSVQAMRESFVSMRPTYKAVLRTLLFLLYQPNPVEIKEPLEAVKRAHEFLFQRYILENTHVTLDASAYEALVNVLADPQVQSNLFNAMGQEKIKLVRSLCTKPHPDTLIERLDKAQKRLSGTPLLVVIISALEEPVIRDLATLLSNVTVDPYYDRLKGLIYKVMSILLNNGVQGSVKKAMKELEDLDGYYAAVIRIFFEDLPKHRQQLESMMGTRPARDSLRLLMLWSGLLEFNMDDYKFKEGFMKGLNTLGHKLFSLEKHFMYSMRVFADAIYRSCQPSE